MGGAWTSNPATSITEEDRAAGLDGWIAWEIEERAIQQGVVYLALPSYFSFSSRSSFKVGQSLELCAPRTLGAEDFLASAAAGFLSVLLYRSAYP